MGAVATTVGDAGANPLGAGALVVGAPPPASPAVVSMPISAYPKELTTAQRVVEAHVMAVGTFGPGIGDGPGDPGLVGSNGTWLPSASMAKHRPVEGHATSTMTLPESMVAAEGESGLLGLNVTSSPVPAPVSPTAVHCDTDGHDSPYSGPAETTVAVGDPGAPGSNDSSRPASSTVTHTVADGHATDQQDVVGINRRRGGCARRVRIKAHYCPVRARHHAARDACARQPVRVAGQ